MKSKFLLTPEDWHQRYLEQAAWSQDIRRYLFSKSGLTPEGKILEVGSGTGAVLRLLVDETSALRFGIDIDFINLLFSATADPLTHLAAADGFRLPFSKASFSIAFCHYLLLWITQPLDILKEMMRVTKPGGLVAALAEPDYRARIDHPQALTNLGTHQTNALKEQGVDDAIGRKLPGLFHQAGLHNITSGILGAQWESSTSKAIYNTEWMIIQSDLKGRITPAELEHYHQLELSTQSSGERVLFIPTFYAAGVVPG